MFTQSYFQITFEYLRKLQLPGNVQQEGGNNSQAKVQNILLILVTIYFFLFLQGEVFLFFF